MQYTKNIVGTIGDTVYFINIEAKRGKLILREPYLIPCTIRMISGSFNGNVYICALNKNKLITARQELFTTDYNFAKKMINFISSRIELVDNVIYYNKSVCDGLSMLIQVLKLEFYYSKQISLSVHNPIEDYYFNIMNGYSLVYYQDDKGWNITNNYSITQVNTVKELNQSKEIITDGGRCVTPFKIDIPLLTYEQVHKS